MPVGGAFLGGVSERVPAGKTLIILQAVTEDNKNLSTAKWTISASGRKYSTSAGADGRAEQLVDSGFTYTVSLTISGGYSGSKVQTVVADSTGTAFCQFVLSHGATFSKVKVDSITPLNRMAYFKIPNVEKGDTLSVGVFIFLYNSSVPIETYSTYTIHLGYQKGDVPFTSSRYIKDVFYEWNDLSKELNLYFEPGQDVTINSGRLTGIQIRLP